MAGNNGLRDTSMIPDDDDPTANADGYTTLLAPEGGGGEEDEAAFEGLLDAGLSIEEAQETIDFMRPLDDDEESLLDSYPLGGLRRVDDSEHDQWLNQKFNQGTSAMDRVLEDAVYGEDPMNDEERMEREDVDSAAGLQGWGFKSAFRKIGRGIKKGASYAKKGVLSPVKLAKKFVPGRDAGKATLVKNLYQKLWYEHANWLATQDKNAGVALKSRPQYEAVAKMWARGEIAKKNLPLQYAVGGATILGSEIMGSEIMGAWWNPFSWFSRQAQAVLANTADQRADQAPDEQAAQVVAPDMNLNVQDTSMQPEQQYDPSAQPDQQYDPSANASQGWNGVRQVKAPHDPVSDSLGAFVAHVLGRGQPTQPAQPAKDNPEVDKIVREIVVKLKAGNAISPGEIGLLSSAAREGNAGAQRVIGVLRSRGAVVSGDSSGLDPWMYKLNPSYWFASSRKKGFIDKEKKAWSDNADARKQLAKQQEDLDAAEKAAQAAQAVEQAKAQSAETEAKLKAIADSLKGAFVGSFVGHEKVTPISDVVRAALKEAGKGEAAGKLYAKIREGKPLDKDELKEARQIARIVGKMRVVHGDLVNDTDGDVQGTFVGACTLGAIGAALEQNAKHQRASDYLAKKVAAGQPLSSEEKLGLANVLRGQQKLRNFTASLVSGRAFVGCDDRKTWTRGAFVGAVKAMSPEDKKMLSTIVKLAKIGNPRAEKALAALKKSGEISGGDSSIGFGIKKFFKYATAPVWLPAKGIYKGSQALFGSKGRPSPEQVRLDKLRAAQKRSVAAQARARAADAQNEAEFRAQQAIAAAADAEADAADAEATNKEQAMRTAEIEAAPDLANQSADEDQAGAFVGSWDALVGKGTRGSKALKLASSKTHAGTKIRSAAVIYKRAKKGDPKARRAVEVMVSRAKKGDQQALRDVNAMKAARMAIRTRATAQKKQLAAQKKLLASRKRAARKAQVLAAQKRFEVRAANRLARMSRKHELRKLARVERLAARGNPKAKKFVASRVAASKRGDKKALAQVQAMRLGRKVRLTVKTPRERKNMRDAAKFARRLQKNDPRAIRQYRILQAAASRGNPNAKRALSRLALQGAVMATVATGVVVLPKVASKKKARKPPQPGSPEYAQLQKQVALAKEKAASGVASREELIASAKKAQAIGDREGAGQLAMASSAAPSTTETVKSKAAVVAAAQSGNKDAQAQLDKNLAGAREGNPDDINALGHVAAARTVDAVERGQPISPAMRDAVNLQERARAGDPAAQETLREVSEAATQPNPSPEATAAATYATGAAVLASALASKPKARREFMEKVNPVAKEEVPAAQAELNSLSKKADEGTITAEEGERGINLAMKLGKPRVAAEISAKAPPAERHPMSSLPDNPLPPISGPVGLLKASLQAFTFSTRDPLGNYREGVAARSRSAPTTSTGDCGWSPFDFFRKAKASLPMIAMVSSPVAAAASVANLLKKDRRSAPAAAPAAPLPAAAPSPTPATAAAAPAPTPTATAGDDKSFKDLVAAALKSKKMSRDDFNKAVAAHLDAKASKEVKAAAGEQVLKFLEKRGVKVG